MTWEDLITQTGRVVIGNTAYLRGPQQISFCTPMPYLPTATPRVSTPVRACPSEDDEQRSLFAWRDMVLAQEPLLALLYHCPNGKQRSKAAAGQLKAMGVKRHVPDLFLPLARDGFHGCYIELKALNGTVPPGQKALHAQLREQGYYVAVAFGWVAAAHELCRYLHRLDLAKQLEGTR